jgi:uncharacterized protein (DUF433 family)
MFDSLIDPRPPACAGVTSPAVSPPAGPPAMSAGGGRVARLPASDRRLATPLYTVRETAAYVGVPFSTFRAWVRGYERRAPGRPPVIGAAVVHALPARGPTPTVPFIGLVEGHVLSAFRRAGVPLPRIRAALARLTGDRGLEHALASRHLSTDGRDVLYDYARDEGPEVIHSLTVVESGQRVFRPVVEEHLRLITWDEDGWPIALRLPAFERAAVVVDPQRCSGRPRFLRGGARIEDVVGRVVGGDDIEEIARDAGVAVGECLEAVRVLGRLRRVRAA